VDHSGKRQGQSSRESRDRNCSERGQILATVLCSMAIPVCMHCDHVVKRENVLTQLECAIRQIPFGGRDLFCDKVVLLRQRCPCSQPCTYGQRIHVEENGCSAAYYVRDALDLLPGETWPL